VCMSTKDDHMYMGIEEHIINVDVFTFAGMTAVLANMGWTHMGLDDAYILF